MHPSLGIGTGTCHIFTVSCAWTRLVFSLVLFSLMLFGGTFVSAAAPQLPLSALAISSFPKPPPSHIWNLQVVDETKQLGEGSLRLDSAGHPHLAYGGDQIYYAWHDGTEWHYEIVDGGGGNQIDLALDAADQPHITFCAPLSPEPKYGCAELKYARWTGSAWAIETLGYTGYANSGGSLALDAAGNPHITYAYGIDILSLGYMYWTGSEWSGRYVDNMVDGYCSLALDAAGNPHISYGRNHELKYARWTDNAWAIESVDIGVSWSAATLALDSGDQPHISYSTDGQLKYAQWTGSEWAIENVDSGGRSSLALDAADNPHLSYYDATNADLKYARQTGSTWAIETVTSEGGPSSLALDAAGNPHISYGSNGNLKYARWTGSAWDIESVDTAGYIGSSSLKLDAADVPQVSYYDSTRGDLKYARGTDSGWAIETVDSVGNVGDYSSLALDATGNPHLSYYDATHGDLKYAYWTGDDWNIETVSGKGDVGQYTSLALDAAGNAHISFYDATNGDLEYMRWTGSRWVGETIDSDGDAGKFSSLALDALGKPHISYSTDGDLRHARKAGNTWAFEIVDNGGTVSFSTSLVMDAIGNPHISYQGKQGIKYAHRRRSEWSIEIVSNGYGPTYLALAPVGNPYISYTRFAGAWMWSLEYARRTARAWAVETVDGARSVGSSAMALDARGDPHIIYSLNGDLKYAVGLSDCSQAPAAPLLTAPRDGVIHRRRRVKLNWTDVACVARYEVVVKKDSAQGQVVDGNENLAKSKYTTKKLTRDKTYYWQARACGEAGCSEWTEYRRFTIRASAHE